MRGHRVWATVKPELRSLWRAPSIAIPVVVTLAVSSGIAATLYATFDAAVLKSVPGPHADRIVAISTTSRSSSLARALTRDVVAALAGQTQLFEAVGWFRRIDAVRLPQGQALGAAVVSPAFFGVYGVAPSHGRVLAGEANIVLSERGWKTVFAGDIGVVDSELPVSGIRYRVVAIMPSEFTAPDALIDVWISESRDSSSAGAADLHAIARLARGITIDEARAAVATLGGAVGLPPSAALRLVPLRDQLAGSVGAAWTMLAVAIALLVSIGASNIATLLLIRSSKRRNEFALRTSLGASDMSLLGLSMVTPLALGVIGGVLAVAVAHAGTDLVRAFGPASIPRLGATEVGGRVVAVAFGLSLAVGVLAAVAPTVPLSRRPTRLVSSSAPRLASMYLLCGLQLSLVVALASIASVCLLTFARIGGVDVGFVSEGLVGALTQSRLRDRGTSRADTIDVLDTLSRLEGVEAVAVATMIPVGRLRPFGTTVAVNRLGEWVPMPGLTFQAVSESYFDVMRIPIVEGRRFDAGDVWTAPCVVIVSKLLAAEAWPGTSPQGERVNLAVDGSGLPTGPSHECQVVGVVGDTRVDLASPPQPQIYFPFQQRPGRTESFLVRSHVQNRLPVAAVTSALVAIGAAREVLWVGAMDTLVRRVLVGPRFYATLATAFTAVGIVLSLVGVYASSRYVLTSREKEVGVRLALGGTVRRVHAAVVKPFVVVVAVSALAGAAGAVVAARFASTLSPLGPLEAPVVLVCTMIVAAVAVATAWIGTRRVAHIDPRELLRRE